MCFRRVRRFSSFLSKALALSGLVACTALAAACGSHPGSTAPDPAIETFDPSIRCTVEAVYERIVVTRSTPASLEYNPPFNFKNVDNIRDTVFTPQSDILQTKPGYLNTYRITGIVLDPGYWQVSVTDPARYREDIGEGSVLVDKTIKINGVLLTKEANGPHGSKYTAMTVHDNCTVDANPVRY